MVTSRVDPSIVAPERAQFGTVIDLGGGCTTFSDSAGTTGTIVDLGGGFTISSDSAGRTGTIVVLGNMSEKLTSTDVT